MPLYKAWVYIIQISIGTVGLSAAHRAGTPCVIKKKEKEKKNPTWIKNSNLYYDIFITIEKNIDNTLRIVGPQAHLYIDM